MRILLIGPGAIAADHVRALRGIPGTEIVSVVGRAQPSAERFAAEWGVPEASDDLAAALDRTQPDLAVICSPNARHAEQARMCLDAGAHVVVEIPAALSLAECEALLTCAEERGRTVQACHTMRSFPAMRHLRDLVVSGEQQVSAVSGFFGIPRRENQGFLGTRSWVDDLLWHHGCHVVDIAMWLAGATSSADHHLLAGRAHPQFGMTMDIAVQFSLPGQVIVSHALSYNVTSLTWQVRLTGSTGDWLFHNGELLDGTGTVLMSGDSIRDLAWQDTQMLAHIREGTPSDFTLAGVLPAMTCLHQLAAAEATR